MSDGATDSSVPAGTPGPDAAGLDLPGLDSAGLDPAGAQPDAGAGSSAARLAAGSTEELAAATDAAISTARAGIERVKAGGGSATEVLESYDEAVAALANTRDLADLIGKTHPSEAMRDAADAAHQACDKEITEIALDRAVYDVLCGLDVSGEDDATRHFLARTLRDFRRSGVDRDESVRARVRELQEELVTIGQAFGRNIRSDTRTILLPPSALDGLPEDYVRGHAPGEDGLVRITTDYPDLVPFMSYATDGTARQELWRINRQRGFPANVDVIRELLAKRHELATILGYPSWAQYITEDKMIGSERAAGEFIARISAAATERAAADYATLLARKRVEEPDATAVLPWDTGYLQDRVKAEQLDFDTQSVRPYFEYRAVKDGLMALLGRLFGITFTARPDVPRWHEEVEVFDVIGTGDDTLLGRIFLDMHPRADKYNHAAMFTMVNGKAGQRVPECALVCNLPRPGAEPALMVHSDVVTFFHEFGHLIHHIFAGHNRWSGIGGISTEWDFVEAPSQLLEEWVRDEETLAGFARHYQTGEPLPAETVRRLRAADEFGKGLFVRQQMSYAALSLELYRRDPAELDPLAVERETIEAHTPFQYVDGTYMHLAFGHLDGYSAIYYTYMWSLVIAKDLFTVFAADGLQSEQAAARYRRRVLAPGGARPAAELVSDFLGREYTFEAYRAWLND
jgi:thimet oligopeptidase